MKRREFLGAAGAAVALGGATLALPALSWAEERSKLKITGLRLVRTKPKRAYPQYQPAKGSWLVQGSEVASPVSIYPEYRAMRSLFAPSNVESFTVEVTTDKGITGLGQGGPGGGPIVTGHLAKLMIGRDPFDVERNWDINWRATMSYGQAGVVMNAISGVDIALWDIIGKALDVPVYELLGGETKDRIPVYCTGNDIEQHVEFGFSKIKLAMPHGPASGRAGMTENVALVQRARRALGPDGELMLDSWMSWTEQYTIEMAETLKPYRIYWIEEPLPPYDYEGFGRLKEAVKPIRVVCGEHEYGRYSFRRLLEVNGASIWQPDLNWCGGLTELRKIGALAAAYDIPVIPHRGGMNGSAHWTIASVNAPWSELFMPAPGGPNGVYKIFEETYQITRGPEGLYMHPPSDPGWGWDFEVAGPA